MRRAVVALALCLAVTVGIQSSMAHAKRHSAQDEDTESDAEDGGAALSANCNFAESRMLGNQDPSRSLQEKCENRASEMCIFGFGSRGFKPRQIHIDPAIHAACQTVTTPSGLGCVTSLRKALKMSGGQSLMTGSKRRNRIVYLPALTVSEIRRCASQ
jgi:hypothetical protein